MYDDSIGKQGNVFKESKEIVAIICRAILTVDEVKKLRNKNSA